MLYLLSSNKKIIRQGSTLLFEVPSKAVRLMGLKKGMPLYACIEGNTVVYSKKKARRLCTMVRVRVVSKIGERTYYGLTLPKTFALLLGIEAGTSVAIYYDDERSAIILRGPQPIYPHGVEVPSGRGNSEVVEEAEEEEENKDGRPHHHYQGAQ